MRLFLGYALVLIFSAAIPAQAQFKIPDIIKQGVQNRDEHNKSKPQASPLEDLAKKDIKKAKRIGQFAGGLAGGTLAYVLSGDTKDKGQRIKIVATGVGAGVVIGGEIGKKIGERAANRRRQYAREYDYLQSEITASEKAISVRESELEKSEKEIVKVQTHIAELQAKEKLTKKDKKKAKKLKRKLEKQIKENELLLAQYEEKIGYLDHALSTSTADADSTTDEIKLYERKHASLTQKKQELMAQYVNVGEQGELMASNHQLLDNMLS